MFSRVTFLFLVMLSAYVMHSDIAVFAMFIFIAVKSKIFIKKRFEKENFQNQKNSKF